MVKKVVRGTLETFPSSLVAILTTTAILELRQCCHAKINALCLCIESSVFTLQSLKETKKIVRANET